MPLKLKEVELWAIELFRLGKPRRLTSLLGRASRNREFFSALVEYAESIDEKGGADALQRLISHLYKRKYEGDTRRWQSSSKGFAAELLERAPWISEQLNATKHLAGC